jgi:hypothetical protein
MILVRTVAAALNPLGIPKRVKAVVINNSGIPTSAGIPRGIDFIARRRV